MKKRREKLFKDKDILIPIRNSTNDNNLKFWAHRSKYKKKVVVKVLGKKLLPLKGNFKNESYTELKNGSEKNIVEFKVNELEYQKSLNKKGSIELIFKRKRKIKEKVVAGLTDFVKSILHAPKNIKNLFKRKISLFDLKALFKERKKERLSALRSFWSSRIGTLIFRTSANAVGSFLVIPLLILRRKFYIADIPNVERLGHAVANLDVLQAEFDQGMYKTAGDKVSLIIFYPQISEIEDIGTVYFPRITYIRQISKSLARKNIRILYLHPWIEKVLKRGLLKTGSSFLDPKPYGHRDIFNTLSKSPSLMSLSQNEEKRCIKYFEEKNFKIESPLILLSNRSSGNINFSVSDTKKLSEHKRYGYRNSPFEALIPSIQDLLGKGYTVIKVGSASGKYELSSDRYFDFSAQPSPEKSILLDLFLFSRCLFYIGDTSGNYSLAQAFRKPICFLNFAPFGHFHSWSENSISIFKNVKNQRTGKLEKFSNLLKYEHGYEVHNDKADLTRRYVSNTKKENLETVKEMEARISGGLYDSNEHLQRRFQKLFIPSYLHQSVNSKCGNYFLEKYEHLLK